MNTTNKIKQFRNNLLLRNLFLIFCVLIVVIISVLIWLNIYTRHNQAIVVPAIKGLQIKEALAILERQGLRFEVIDSVYSKTESKGSVIEQIPNANTKVKEGRIIFLTVNANSVQTVSIPDIMELSARQATATLEALGFKMDSLEYVSHPYRDLAVNIKYHNKNLKVGDKIPFGSTLKLQVGDGNMPTVQDTDSIGESEKSWFE